MRNIAFLIAAATIAGGCNGSGSAAGDAGTNRSDATASGEGGGDGGTITTDAGAACAALTTQQARVACAASAVLATLSDTQLASVNLPMSDYTNRSKWNNLPVMLRPRAGVQTASLGATTQAAVLDMMNIALNDNGRDTMTGILRADDYLATMASGYGSSLYSVAIFGTPSDTGTFEVMFGGHHMAYNLDYAGGAFYPVPQHLGCEPKASLTFNGGTYAPLAPTGDALFAIYDSLTTAQQSTAYLSGQTFADVIVSPDLDYGKGSARTLATAYPTGANRIGVLVSSMDASQQALVIAAMEQWVRQYPAEVADPLMADYVTTTALADTYFA